MSTAQSGESDFGDSLLAGIELAVADILAADPAKQIEWQPSQFVLADGSTADQIAQLRDPSFDAIIGLEAKLASSVVEALAAPCQTVATFDAPDLSSSSSRKPSADNPNSFSFSPMPPAAKLAEAAGEVIANTGYSTVEMVKTPDEDSSTVDLNTEIAAQLLLGLEAKGIAVIDAENRDDRAESVDSRDESSRVIVVVGLAELANSNLDAATVGSSALYVVDYEMGLARWQELGAAKRDLLAQATVITVAPPHVEGFYEQLLELDPDLNQVGGAAYSYDATVALTLASYLVAADGSGGPTSALVSVTTGGTQCVSFDQCRAMLIEGTDINYRGLSGPLDIGEAGVTKSATFASFGVADDGLVFDSESATYQTS